MSVFGGLLEILVSVAELRLQPSWGPACTQATGRGFVPLPALLPPRLPSSAKAETCVWCRCWSGTSLASSGCCFLLRWFLSNMCRMHNQHLGEAAVGKRKLTQNINSQILECASVAARLALGESPAGAHWEAVYFVCGLQRGNFGGITRVSKTKNE